ncbi:hypothetical protein SSTU70S_03261 [Stutzerimonas stutzeri]
MHVFAWYKSVRWLANRATVSALWAEGSLGADRCAQYPIKAQTRYVG